MGRKPLSRGRKGHRTAPESSRAGAGPARGAGRAGRGSEAGALIPVRIEKPGPPGPAAPERPAEAALAGFVSENTKRAYRRDIMDFFETADLEGLTMARVLGVTPEDVTAFRDKLMAARMKPATVARKLSAIRAIYNHLMARGSVRLNPADTRLVRSPKRPTIRSTLYLSWDQARTILRSPDRRTETGRRDYAMLLMDMNTGLRRSELCHLHDGDVVRQADRWAVRLRGKGGKERFIPIRDIVHKALEEWLAIRPDNGEGWLFTTLANRRFTEHSFWKAIRRYGIMAGMVDQDGKPTLHPHSLRAAYIKFQLDKGTKVDVLQQLVGHSRGDTTLGYVAEIELLGSGADEKLEGLDGEA